MANIIHDSAGDVADQPFPPAGVAWFVVAVLFVVTLFSQLDRQLPALLVKPIKAEFGISDTGFSLLQGYAFAFVYTIMGLPFGRLVDRTNRRNLIIAGVALWSVMTVLSGIVTSYAGLFVARMGIGVGEAVLAPAAYSLIADYVGPERRGRATSVYYLSLAVGQGASLLLGGMILRMVPVVGLTLPLIGHVDPWRVAFLIAGAPGVLLVLLLLAVREPQRRENAGADIDADRGSIRELVAYVCRHGGAFLPIFMCPLCLAIIGYASVNWGPAFYERHYGLQPGTIGLTLGALIAAGGVLGTLVSGFVGDRLVARGTAAARLRVMLISWAVMIPTSLLWTAVPSLPVSLTLFGIMGFASVLGHSCVPVMVQEIVPNRMRGQIIATYLLVAGLGGIAIAPTIVALITDRIFHDDAAVGWSLAIVSAPVGLVGLAAALRGLRPYARTQAEIRLRGS